MTDIEFKGKVSAIDQEKRTLHIKDEKGTNAILVWTDVLDVVMRKWKPGYYLVLKYDADTYIIKSSVYWQEGKDLFPKEKGNFKPRNERLIVVQVLVKAWTELYVHSMIPDEVDFNKARQEILQAVRDDISTVMEIGGEGK